ncbi:MAG: 7-cyano-7-deazaguanine synthase, partial [Selenomonadaceae bacterium]|nr:7-cyano-7-deazaguanine synthase [Selenomonadaceae bacterium]
KKEIILLAKKLNVPLELTRSCYAGKEKACGVCESCKLRLKGFKEAGLVDPIEYLR